MTIANDIKEYIKNKNITVNTRSLSNPWYVNAFGSIPLKIESMEFKINSSSFCITIMPSGCGALLMHGYYFYDTTSKEIKDLLDLICTKGNLICTQGKRSSQYKSLVELGFKEVALYRNIHVSHRSPDDNQALMLRVLEDYDKAELVAKNNGRSTKSIDVVKEIEKATFERIFPQPKVEKKPNKNEVLPIEV